MTTLPNPPLVAVRPKSMWTSKTFILNALTLIVGIGGDLIGVFELPPWAISILAVANIVLRRISDQPARFRADEMANPPMLEKAALQPRGTHA